MVENEFPSERPTELSVQPEAVPRCAARWPDLSNFSDKQLNLLRSVLRHHMRDARKKAIAAIAKDSSLGRLHMQALGKPGSAADKELTRRLPENPDAFVADFMANSLAELDTACLETIKKRFKAATKTKS
jgi:hypothetical protein